MSKLLKYSIIGVFSLVILFILSQVIIGVSDYKKTMKDYNLYQNIDKYSELYIPENYEVINKDVQADTEFGDIIMTLLSNGSGEIEILESKYEEIPCKGEIKDMEGLQVCYFAFGTIPNNPDSKLIMWGNTDKSMQIKTNDKSLADEELYKIIQSLN